MKINTNNNNNNMNKIENTYLIIMSISFSIFFTITVYNIITM